MAARPRPRTARFLDVRKRLYAGLTQGDHLCARTQGRCNQRGMGEGAETTLETSTQKIYHEDSNDEELQHAFGTRDSGAGYFS